MTDHCSNAFIYIIMIIINTWTALVFRMCEFRAVMMM